MVLTLKQRGQFLYHCVNNIAIKNSTKNCLKFLRHTFSFRRRKKEFYQHKQNSNLTKTIDLY